MPYLKSLVNKEVPCDGSELVFDWKPSNASEDREIEYQNFQDKSFNDSSIKFGSFSTVKDENNNVDNNFLSSSLVAKKFIQNKISSQIEAKYQGDLDQIVESRHPLSTIQYNNA